MIIGIAGSFGSGKGMVADYLVKQKGFFHFSAREFIFQEAEKRGLSRDGGREVLIPVANDLRAKGGPAFIADALYSQAVENGGDAVLESFRAIAEVERLQELGGVVLGVDAAPEIRYERTVARGSETDHVSFEEWRNHETRESNPDDRTKQDIFGSLAASDHVVKNEGTIEELHQKVEEWLQTIA